VTPSAFLVLVDICPSVAIGAKKNIAKYNKPGANNKYGKSDFRFAGDLNLVAVVRKIANSLCSSLYIFTAI
ncbi:MAG: hypothetical protein RLZZ378_294, partial [Actinomycetota bacterium]